MSSLSLGALANVSFSLGALANMLPIKNAESRMWSVGILCLAAFAFPYVVVATLALAGYYRLITPKPEPLSGPIRTAIVTGGKMTKALQTARILKKAGCRVVMVETHKYYMVASRFSNAIDRFVTVPVPEQEPEEYLKALKVLAYEEDADLFVPVSSPVASVYDARVGKVLPPTCTTLSPGEAMTAALDDKVTFSEMAKLAGCTTPETKRMNSKEEVHAFNEQLRAQGESAPTYILKNLQYDSMHRLDLFTVPCEPAKLTAYLADPTITMTAEAPWACQQFVVGDECCGHVIAHEGNVALYTDNVASISCFNYEHLGSELIREWVHKFVKHHQLSGVMCFDFIVDEKTKIPYSIECNPRMSSNITHFHNSPSVARAFLDPKGCALAGHTETPLPSAGETCWTVVDVYYALTKPGYTLSQRARAIYETLFHKKDAYFEPYDILPFLMLHFVHIPTLLARNVVNGRKWAKIDMCIGKLTEENGD